MSAARYLQRGLPVGLPRSLPKSFVNKDQQYPRLASRQAQTSVLRNLRVSVFVQPLESAGKFWRRSDSFPIVRGGLCFSPVNRQPPTPTQHMGPHISNRPMDIPELASRWEYGLAARFAEQIEPALHPR